MLGEVSICSSSTEGVGHCAISTMAISDLCSQFDIAHVSKYMIIQSHV